MPSPFLYAPCFGAQVPLSYAYAHLIPENKRYSLRDAIQMLGQRGMRVRSRQEGEGERRQAGEGSGTGGDWNGGGGSSWGRAVGSGGQGSALGSSRGWAVEEEG